VFKIIIVHVILNQIEISDSDKSSSNGPLE